MAMINTRHTLLAYGVWIGTWMMLFTAGPQDHHLFILFLAATYTLFLADKLHFINRDHFVEVAGSVCFVSMLVGIFSSTGFFLAAGLLIGILTLLRKD